jgi:hypothetical protein
MKLHVALFSRRILRGSMSRCLVLLSVLLCITAPPCFSQQAAQVGQIIEPFRTLVSQNASLISTERFKPQIDATFRLQPERPENPLLLGWRTQWTFPWDNLPVGGVFDEARVQPQAQFPAIDATGWTPPDPDIAVGRNHVIVTVNSSLAFFRKSDGVKTFQQTFGTFFTGMGAGSFLFDPKCFYDRASGRFVVSVLEQSGSPQTSKVLIAVSDDGDPTGTWYRYRLESIFVVNGQNYWLDYHSNGHNQNAFVFCGNLFGFSGGFGGVGYLVIPKAPALSGGAVTVSYLRDGSSGSAQLCEMIGENTSYIYAVNTQNSGQLRVHALGNLTGTPTLQSQLVSIPSFTYPSLDNASTSGRTLDSLDGRLFNAIWRSGSLVTTHTVRTASSTTNRVRWYELQTNAWPVSGSVTLRQSGEAAGASGVFHHMGVINKNRLGDISLVFSRSSTGIVADLMTAARFETDALGTVGTPQLLESSLTTYGGSGDNRWGDYFGIDVDPSDDVRFWGVGMTGNASGGWRTSFFTWVAGTTQALYVDRSYVGTEDGTMTRPFNTLQEALSAASTTQRTYIFVRPNDYREYPSITKRVVLINWTGEANVRVGTP